VSVMIATAISREKDDIFHTSIIRLKSINNKDVTDVTVWLVFFKWRRQYIELDILISHSRDMFIFLQRFLYCQTLSLSFFLSFADPFKDTHNLIGKIFSPFFIHFLWFFFDLSLCLSFQSFAHTQHNQTSKTSNCCLSRIHLQMWSLW